MAKKEKTVYICSSCGDSFPRWMGQCPSCKAWNSLEETVMRSEALRAPSQNSNEAVQLDQSPENPQERMNTPLKELNRLLGGGLVPGSVVLIGGEPGVGKSTLLLTIAGTTKKTLYIAGEESRSQVENRARRINASLDSVFLLQETSLSNILAQMQKLKPELILVDSIQTVYSDESRGFSGSPVQVREATSAFIEYAKAHSVPVILTGHVTKEGQIAGPKLLEHAVDVVLYFESQRSDSLRVIRSVKNRYGTTDEIAVYEMHGEGLREMPADRGLLEIGEIGGIGSVLFPQVSGSQVIPLEVQVLVAPSGFSNGRRIGENLDNSRIHLIAAILEKYLKLRMSQMDIFVRVFGATSLVDSAGDLALLVAMMESYLEKKLDYPGAIAGDVSLTGQIRAPAGLDRRRKSLETLGIRHALWGGQQKGSADEQYISRVEGLQSHVSARANNKID